MKGNKVNGLYFLQCNTMTDSADVSSSDNFERSTVLAQQSEKRFMSHVPCSSALESIMHVMTCIHPNISHAINVVSLSKVYWQAMKWTLHYLQGATNFGLVSNKDSGIGSNVGGYYAGVLIVTRVDITLKKIALKKNPTDMLTKPVLVLKFKSYLDLIVVYSL
jgi:hypothetical protein